MSISYAVFCLKKKKTHCGTCTGRRRTRSNGWKRPASTACSASPAPTVTSVFFFNDTATTEIYTLSLHDALPIFNDTDLAHVEVQRDTEGAVVELQQLVGHRRRSEEHTSELQSHVNLVCRLLLEKKKIIVLLLSLLKKNNKNVSTII